MLLLFTAFLIQKIIELKKIMKVQHLRCIKFVKSLLLIIVRNEMTTWGAKQVSDIFKDSDSETFYICPNCLD